jgi:hypothetical protein
MSTANIVSKIPLPDFSAVTVTFDSHGQKKVYIYAGEEATAAIMGGQDPAKYDGKRIG